jgi:hypothetical protein
MPRDIEQDADGGFSIDETRDLSSVTGDAYIRQHITRRLAVEVDTYGEAMTDSRLNELQDDVVDVLKDDPYTDPPYRVTVTSRTPSTGTVELRVQTNSQKLVTSV